MNFLMWFLSLKGKIDEGIDVSGDHCGGIQNWPRHVPRDNGKCVGDIPGSAVARHHVVAAVHLDPDAIAEGVVVLNT